MEAMKIITSMRRPVEYRWGNRVALGVPVRWTSRDEHAGSGQLQDASLSGAWIVNDQPLPMFTNLVVEIPRQSNAQRALELVACVTRRDPRGFAIEWRDMASQAVQALLQGAPGKTSQSPCHNGTT